MFVVDCGLIMAYVFFYKDPPLRDRSGQVIPPRLLAAGFFRNKIGWAVSAGKELKTASVLKGQRQFSASRAECGHAIIVDSEGLRSSSTRGHCFRVAKLN